MAYPPSVPPNNRQNNTASFDNHPGDHNDIANALNDIINELGSNPSGGSATVEARLNTLLVDAANSVSESNIANGAVTEDKLGAGAVTNGKIANNAVQANSIQANAVGKSEIASGVASHIRFCSPFTRAYNVTQTFSAGTAYTIDLPATIGGVSMTNAVGVFAYLTITQPAGNGDLTVWKNGTTKPSTAIINYITDTPNVGITGNFALIDVDSSGRLSIRMRYSITPTRGGRSVNCSVTGRVDSKETCSDLTVSQSSEPSV